MLQLGVNFSEIKLSNFLFADGFIGVAETRSALQDLIDTVHKYSKHNYSKRWCFGVSVKSVPW